MKIDPQSLRDVATSLSLAAADVEALRVGEMSEKVGNAGLSESVSGFEEAWRHERYTLHSLMADTARALAQAANLFDATDGDVRRALSQALLPTRPPVSSAWRRAV